MIIPRIRIKKREFYFNKKKWDISEYKWYEPHHDNKKPFTKYTTGCSCQNPPDGCDGHSVWYHVCVLWFNIHICNWSKFLSCQRNLMKTYGNNSNKNKK